MRKKAATKRATKQGGQLFPAPQRSTWQGPSRVWWGDARLNGVGPNKLPPAPLPDFLRPLFSSDTEPCAAGGKQRTGIPPTVGQRVPLSEHANFRERWLTIRKQLNGTRVSVTDEHLDRTADFLLASRIGHEAAIHAARTGVPGFCDREVQTTQETLRAAGNRKRQLKLRFERACRDGLPRSRRKKLEQKLVEASHFQFFAQILNENAIERFNAEWALVDSPGIRQRVIEEAVPVAWMALHLEGSFGYKPAEVSRLLAAADFIGAPVATERGEKSPALDRVLKARSRALR